MLVFADPEGKGLAAQAIRLRHSRTQAHFAPIVRLGRAFCGVRIAVDHLQIRHPPEGKQFGPGGVAMLVHGQNFWANAVRAYALQLALIAAFAALGVMLGAAFSMPVAAFAATVLYVLSMIAPALAEEIYPADEDEKKGFMMRAGEAVTLAMQKSFEPLLSPEPLTKLTRGEKIPTSTLTRALTLGALCFPGLAMLAFWAILGLRRSQED